jgi:hypothetical protein
MARAEQTYQHPRSLNWLYSRPHLLQRTLSQNSLTLCCFTECFWKLTGNSVIWQRDQLAVIIKFNTRAIVGKYMDGAKDMNKEMLPIWAAFLCAYPLLLLYFLPTKNTQHQAVLSWYMYSGAPPSCNSCYVCKFMRIPIVVCVTKKLDSAAIYRWQFPALN